MKQTNQGKRNNSATKKMNEIFQKTQIKKGETNQTRDKNKCIKKEHKTE